MSDQPHRLRHREDRASSLSEISCWREAYSKMGVKPSKFHSSIESLLRRVKKGQEFATGLPIVDFYNLISVTSGAPIGAYDANRLGESALMLRNADPTTDRFEPLGGHSDAFPLNPALVVYAMESEVLCWGFNARDSKRVCVENQTTEVLFFSESTSDRFQKRPKEALGKMARILSRVGADVGPVVLFDQMNSVGTV